MATKNVNQPDEGTRNADAPAPEYITQERAELAMTAIGDAAICIGEAWKAYLENGDALVRDAMLQALLERAQLTADVAWCALNDDDAGTSTRELRARLQWKVL